MIGTVAGAVDKIKVGIKEGVSELSTLGTDEIIEEGSVL